jgi:hypothetical protein
MDKVIKLINSRFKANKGNNDVLRELLYLKAKIEELNKGDKKNGI